MVVNSEGAVMVLLAQRCTEAAILLKKTHDVKNLSTAGSKS